MADLTARRDTDAWRGAVRIVRSLGAITEVYRLELLAIRVVVTAPTALRALRAGLAIRGACRIRPASGALRRTNESEERRDRDPNLRSRGSARTACARSRPELPAPRLRGVVDALFPLDDRQRRDEVLRLRARVQGRIHRLHLGAEQRHGRDDVDAELGAERRRELHRLGEEWLAAEGLLFARPRRVVDEKVRI